MTRLFEPNFELRDWEPLEDEAQERPYTLSCDRFMLEANDGEIMAVWEMLYPNEEDRSWAA